MNGSEKFFLTGFVFILVTAWSPGRHYPIDIQCLVLVLTAFFWVGFMSSGDSVGKTTQDTPA